MPLPAPIVPSGRWHRPLLTLAAVNAAMVPVSLVGMLIDDRVLLGAPVWAKVLKFGVSITAYALTMAWLLALQPRARRFGWWLGTVAAITLGIEMALITVQAARGEPSHFGHASDWQDTVGMLMGATIMVFLAAIMLLAVVLAVQRLADRPSRSAIRAGLLLSLAGMLSGFLMFAGVAPEQVRRMDRGEPAMLGGHSVGVADGGASLPVTYWSSTGGDLRIPHFVGLHALQVLPLLALALVLLAGRWALLRDERLRLHLVRIGAACYAGLFALLLWQALRGQPLIQPDLLTLTALGGLVASTGAAATTAVHSARRRASAHPPAAPLTSQGAPGSR